MGLQSQLFRGDAKLEAAAVSDPAHLMPGATGPHVGKIQLALLQLDGARIDPGEWQRSVYGPSTAKAVLAYKQKRNIINRSYQTQTDNIVGKMTMATLDQEMRAQEVRPSGPIWIEPLYPAQRLSGPRYALTPLRGSAGLQAMAGFQDRPRIIPNGPPLVFSIAIPLHGSANFRVINGVGGMVGSMDRSIAVVFDPDQPLAHSGDMRVSQNPQTFRVQGRAPGRTFLVATNKPHLTWPTMLDEAWLEVVHGHREVTVAFHLLGGLRGVATTRSQKDVEGAVAAMDQIYRPQTNITFRNAGISGPLIVPELAQKKDGEGLILRKSRKMPDWEVVTKHRSGATFNVFFVGKINVVDHPFASQVIALTDGQAPHRDCLMQDDLRGIDLGIALAHEVGHALGEQESTEQDALMNCQRPGKTIPLAAAVRMQENLSTF